MGSIAFPEQKSEARSQKPGARSAASPTYLCRSLRISEIPASFGAREEVRSQKPGVRSRGKLTTAAPPIYLCRSLRISEIPDSFAAI
jgi:hypothetical protein